MARRQTRGIQSRNVRRRWSPIGEVVMYKPLKESGEKKAKKNRIDMKECDLVEKEGATR